MTEDRIYISSGGSTFTLDLKPGEITYIKYDHEYSHLRTLFYLLSNIESDNNIKTISELKHEKAIEKFNKINADQVSRKIENLEDYNNLDKLEDNNIVCFFDVDSLRQYLREKTNYSDVNSFLKDIYEKDNDYILILCDSKGLSEDYISSKYIHNILKVEKIDNEILKNNKIDSVIKNTKCLTQEQQVNIIVKFDESIKISSEKRM